MMKNEMLMHHAESIFSSTSFSQALIILLTYKLSLPFVIHSERCTENIQTCLNYLKNKAVLQLMSFYSITFQK